MFNIYLKQTNFGLTLKDSSTFVIAAENYQPNVSVLYKH